MKNKIIFIVIILLVFMILLVPLKGSYAFYSDNKDLEIINTKIGDWKTLIGYLRMNDKNNNLSKELVGDMYRYQGLYTDDIRNYICLGEYCCNAKDCEADNNDYMYRIIGITPGGELKVIKKTSLTNDTIWHKISTENVEWPDSDLFHRLNDDEDGIYKNNSFYSSLSDNLKKIIIKRDWMYGDVGSISPSILYNSNEMYAIETGKAETISGIKSNDSQDEHYKWTKNINAYIGLLYINDALFTYPTGNPENSENLLKTWVIITYNDNNPPNIGVPQDWLMTRYGYKNDERYDGRRLDSRVGISDGYMHSVRGVRPVFYLSSSIKLAGEGTLTDPFIINV